jgi:hypothetical protein
MKRVIVAQRGFAASCQASAFSGQLLSLCTGSTNCTGKRHEKNRRGSQRLPSAVWRLIPIPVCSSGAGSKSNERSLAGPSGREGKLKQNVTCFAFRRPFRTNCGAGNLARGPLWGRLLGGFSGRARVFVLRKSRLRAHPREDSGRDLLPHSLCRQCAMGKVRAIDLEYFPPMRRTVCPASRTRGAACIF